MLLPMPDAPPGIVAGASDTLCDAWRSVAEPLRDNPGAAVLIVGGGAESIGLYAIACAKALGAGEVFYVDKSRERLEIATRLGATALESVPPNAKYPITLDASANSEGLRAAIDATDIEGTCTSAGIYLVDVPLPLRTQRTVPWALMCEEFGSSMDNSMVSPTGQLRSVRTKTPPGDRFSVCPSSSASPRLSVTGRLTLVRTKRRRPVGSGAASPGCASGL